MKLKNSNLNKKSSERSKTSKIKIKDKKKIRKKKKMTLQIRIPIQTKIKNLTNKKISTMIKKYQIIQKIIQKMTKFQVKMIASSIMLNQMHAITDMKINHPPIHTINITIDSKKDIMTRNRN